jgi:hypothetical protein
MAKQNPHPPIETPFFGGMALLLLGIVAFAVGLWQLCVTVFAPEPSNHDRATEVAQLVLLLQRADTMLFPRQELKELLRIDAKLLDTDKQGPPIAIGATLVGRVREVANWVLERDRPESDSRIGIEPALSELVARQDAAVRTWRFQAVLFFVVPLLVIGAGLGWVGLRTLRRLRLPGTVFEAESKLANRKPGELADEVLCLECGKRIPVGTTRCSACGWSYSKP